MENKIVEPNWLDNLRKELLLSKRTHNFTLTRDEVMYLIGGLAGLYKQTNKWNIHDYGYNTVFDAIGAAVKILDENTLSISVKDFDDAMVAAQLENIDMHSHGIEKCVFCEGKGWYLEEHSPIATGVMEMLDFLAERMEFGGIGGSVAKCYAENIRQLQQLQSISDTELVQVEKIKQLQSSVNAYLELDEIKSKRANFDRFPETSRRNSAVELLLSQGWNWNGKEWYHRKNDEI